MNLSKILKEEAEQRLAGLRDTETILNDWIELNQQSPKSNPVS